MATASVAHAAIPMAINWDGIFESSISKVVGFIPNLLIFLWVLFVGWLVAKAVAKLLAVVLERVGFTTLLAKTGADRTLATASIDPLDLIAKLAYYFILLIALQLALTAFGPSNPVSEIVNDIVAWLPRALVAIVILVVAAAVANGVKEILQAALGGLSYGPMLARIVGGFIVALGVIAALNQVGIGLSVTLPVLIAVLATIGGILVVGVGGGLISPMRSRWERWLGRLETDAMEARTPRAPATAGAGAPTTGYTAQHSSEMPPARPAGPSTL